MSVDPQLLDALFRHPSIIESHEIICACCLSSKYLAAAIAERCRGQLAVPLTVRSKQQQKGTSFATWIQRHAALVRKLQFNFGVMLSGGYYKKCDETTCREVLNAVIPALQHAYAPNHWSGTRFKQLQQFRLVGVAAEPRLLAALPSNLTSLECELKIPSYIYSSFGSNVRSEVLYSVSHLKRLSQLKHLDLSSNHCSVCDLRTLAALSQLTQLKLGCITTQQLQALSIHQQSMNEVNVTFKQPTDVRIFADWLRGAHTLTNLEITSRGELKEQTSAIARAILAATGTMGSSALALRRLSVDLSLDTTVYLALASHCHLTRLRCSPNVSDAAGMAEMAALCQLTELQELCIFTGSTPPIDSLATTILQPLTGLVSLSRLDLPRTKPAQLAYLPSQIQEVSVHVAKAVDGESQHLRLDYLTAHTKLVTYEPYVFHACDVLPVACETLYLFKAASIKPVLPLHSLQELYLTTLVNATWHVSELQQLGRLPKLKHVELMYDRVIGARLSAEDAKAWGCMPLKRLSITLAGNTMLPAAVIHGLSALQGLTSLWIDGMYHKSGGGLLMTAVHLATTLGCLTSLERLALKLGHILVDQREPLSRGVDIITSTVLGLPSLSRYCVHLPTLSIDLAQDYW